jgi:hypothetical protein
MLTLTKPLLVWHNGNWSKVDSVFPKDKFFENKLEQHIRSLKGDMAQEITLRTLASELDKGKVITIGEGGGRRSFRYKFIKGEKPTNETIH